MIDRDSLCCCQVKGGTGTSGEGIVCRTLSEGEWLRRLLVRPEDVVYGFVAGVRQ